MYSIDIDIGGTFTDGFFTDGKDVRMEKVLSTPHDITECFMNCVAAGSNAFGLDLAEFLRRSSVARVSTTVGTNLIVQRSGPRLGLIVTTGHEQDLYGTGKAPMLDHFVRQDMVFGISESVDDKGDVVRPLDTDALLAAVRELVHAGARMIVISFRNAWRNAANEHAARTAIRARYPIHYLRSVPLQLGTDIAHVGDDHSRTNSALLNAYIHSEMARTLYRAEDKIRSAGFRNPLLIVHSNGGNARVAKTIALNTLHSGPAVAARGAAELAGLLKLKKVVTADMGGTSFDMAVIDSGDVRYEGEPEIDGVRIAVPMISVDSLGAGGGSIARANDGKLTVGPDSAGSAPGPASYAKGGVEPTVTDANVVLGFIDPNYFLGGRMTLDRAAAERAIERRVARRLGISVPEAAFDIRAEINRAMGEEMRLRLREQGHKPSGFAMFAFGGGGPLHGCAIADHVGIRRIVAFPFGSVFSAYGGSTTSVQHHYAKTVNLTTGGVAEIDAVLAALRDQAERDMVGEGFALSDIHYAAGVEVVVGAKRAWHDKSGKRVRAKDILAGAGRRASIEQIRLTARCDVPHWNPAAVRKLAKGRPAAKTRRPIGWERGRVTDTPIYDRDRLSPGHVVEGPALVEGPDTAYAVAPGWRLEVDPFGSLVMIRS
ncbi:MAG: hydantoinase/oxoprolinase family protein [Alphaproteobacteria bacterium]|nr:hydantoinase/oxoprolinase family protein [Alphaproteobacteria bacterium]